MEFIVLFIVAFAAKSAFDHVRSSMKDSAAARVREVTKASKGKLPKHQAKSAARRDRVGWLGREITHGFPVTRTGWHAGWLGHKTAALQHLARREEAKTTHAEAQASVVRELPDHKKRQADARAITDAILTQVKGSPGKAKGSRKAVRQAADEVAIKRAERQQAGAWPPPLPADAVTGPRQVCRVCTLPGTAYDPLEPAGIGVVHRSHNERGEAIMAAARAGAVPEPGPYAPTRRVDGQPETEADRRFFDHRESGYTGPLTRDGEKPDMDDPQQRADAETLAGMAERAEAEPGPDSARNPTDPTAPPTEGASVSGDTSYTAIIARSQASVARADQRAAEIETELNQAINDADAMQSAEVDSASLAEQMDLIDRLQALKAASSAVGEQSTVVSSGVQQRHGGIQEAITSSSVARAAQPGFYEE